ncbi:MAG: phosphotransferase [Pseudomonadota bacterium]
MTSPSPTTPPLDDRHALQAQFLTEIGWQDARLEPVTGDASSRSYARLRKGKTRALLMSAPPAAETAACPPAATEEDRRALGYNAMARLAGPNLNAFSSIADALRKAGLSAPEVFHADPETGFALIEDLGDDLYARAVPAGADEETLYSAAIDALLALRRAAPTVAAGDAYTMQTYDLLAMEAEVLLLAEWYVPFKTGKALPPEAFETYRQTWREILFSLPAPGQMVLRDFHAENLLWLPDRAGVGRVGMIDFQDGLIGHPAYDVVSLLEDARRDVSHDLAEAMVARYCSGAKEDHKFFEDVQFRAEYALLGAQRNAKILGIFARLIIRDGKPRYKDFLPRVEAHFRTDLHQPALRPVASLMTKLLPDLVQ